MRLRRVRFTVRGTMILVTLAGVVMRHLMATWEATPDSVYHVRRYPDTGSYTVRGHTLLEPDELRPMSYRSRYWRRFLGLGLTDDPCRCKGYFEMVEGRRTIDVRTHYDELLHVGIGNWIESDPYNLPEPAQALLRRPPPPPPRKGATVKGVRRATPGLSPIPIGSPSPVPGNSPDASP